MGDGVREHWGLLVLGLTGSEEKNVLLRVQQDLSGSSCVVDYPKAAKPH